MVSEITRGGGRSSGRETIGRVAAGAIAVKILDQLGIRLMTYSKSIGPIACDPRHFDAEEILKNSGVHAGCRCRRKCNGLSGSLHR